jgi:LysM repeat protein
MKSLCTKGMVYFLLALLVVGAAACTQSKPQVPTPTLVPLANETLIIPAETPLAPLQTPGIIDNATLVSPPIGGETPIAPPLDQTPAGEVTPIIVEPTLLPTPTTVGDTGQPSQPIVATAIPGSETGEPGACTSPYTVQAGEWFYAIARKCGVSPQALLEANPNLNPNVLHPGQTINMPGGGSAPPPQPSGGGADQPPPSGGGECTNPYIVQAGDTLFSIAQRCGTSVDAIWAANDLASPNEISPGQELTIP